MARILPPHHRQGTGRTVGAGDSFVGGLVYGLANDSPMADACCYGTAAGAAAVMTEATALAKAADVERLRGQVSVKGRA